MATTTIGKFLMDKPNTAFGLFQTAVGLKNKNYKQAVAGLAFTGLRNKMESSPTNHKQPVINEDGVRYTDYEYIYHYNENGYRYGKKVMLLDPFGY